MSVLTVLQLDGGARSSVQIVSCGCPQTRWCSFLVSEVENWSVAFVEKSENFGGGKVFLCVSTANLGRMCVCVLGGLVNLGLASGWPARCQTKLTSACWIHNVIEVCGLCWEGCPAVSVLTVLQLDTPSGAVCRLRS